MVISSWSPTLGVVVLAWLLFRRITAMAAMPAGSLFAFRFAGNMIIAVRMPEHTHNAICRLESQGEDGCQCSIANKHVRSSTQLQPNANANQLLMISV
jgi:hypothetical protein